jgi:hypothetical protein
MPLSVYAFYSFAAQGESKVIDAIIAVGLRILHQLVPFGYFLIMKGLYRQRKG